jgi:hypothetical protein
MMKTFDCGSPILSGSFTAQLSGSDVKQGEASKNTSARKSKQCALKNEHCLIVPSWRGEQEVANILRACEK